MHRMPYPIPKSFHVQLSIFQLYGGVLKYMSGWLTTTRHHHHPYLIGSGVRVPFSGDMLSIEDLSGKVGCQVKKCSVEVLKSFLMCHECWDVDTEVIVLLSCSRTLSCCQLWDIFIVMLCFVVFSDWLICLLIYMQCQCVCACMFVSVFTGCESLWLSVCPLPLHGVWWLAIVQHLQVHSRHISLLLWPCAMFALSRDVLWLHNSSACMKASSKEIYS